MRSLLQLLRAPQPSDRERRTQLEKLQAEATQLVASVAEFEAAILRSWSEASELEKRALEAQRALAGARARNRALRASLDLNDWQPLVMLLFACVVMILGSPLALLITAVGSGR